MESSDSVNVSGSSSSPSTTSNDNHDPGAISANELLSKPAKLDRNDGALKRSYDIQKNSSGVYAKKRRDNTEEEVEKPTSTIHIRALMEFVNATKRIDDQSQNPELLMVKHLMYRNAKWYDDGVNISIENPSVVICVTDAFVVDEPTNLSSVLAQVFCSNLTNLFLVDQTCTFNEYKKMVTSNKLGYLELERLTVKGENGNDLDVADLMKELPNVKSFMYGLKPDEEVKSETIRRLAELPPFPKLRELQFLNIKQNFDVEAFDQFSKKNPNVALTFDCRGASAECVQQITEMKEKLRQKLPPNRAIY